MPKLDSNRDAQDQSIFKYALAAGLFLGTVAVAGHAAKGVLGGIGNKAGRAAISGLGADNLYRGLGKTAAGADAGALANAAVKDTFGYNTYKDGLLRQRLTDGWAVNDKQQGGLSRWWFGDRGYSQFKLDKNALNERLMQDGMGWRQRGGLIGGLGWGEIGRADRGVRGLNEMLAGKVPRSGSWAGRDPASLAGRQSMIAEMADAAGVTLKDNQLSEAAMRGYKPLRGVQQGAMSVDDFLINEKAGIYQDFGDSSLFSQRMGDNLTDRQIRQAQRRARTGPVQNQQGRVHQGFGGSVSAMEAEIERNKTRRAIT